MAIAKSSAYQPITAEDDWFEGEDQDIEFTIYRRSTNAAQDVTGWTLEFKLATAKGAVAVLTKSATLTTPASGVVTVSIAAADTAGLSLTQDTTYYYTLARTNAGANQIVAHGEAVIQVRPS